MDLNLNRSCLTSDVRFGSTEENVYVGTRRIVKTIAVWCIHCHQGTLVFRYKNEIERI